MAPFLRDRYHLSLGETGVLISASLAGSVLSLVPWGFATDRFGERAVLLAGLGSCGAALVAAAFAHGFWPLLALLLVAGLAGASVQAASGRAVMAAFPLEQRGLALGSALVVAPQMCVVGFTVLLLHDHRGLSAGWAAAALALVQALGIAARIGAGRWSDVVRSRLAPLRTIAVLDAALVLACAAVLDAPLELLLPLLVVAGVLAMRWNGLAVAAAIEAVGHRRSGVAIGLQQSVLNGFGAVYPGVFGALVGRTSWTCGFVAVALLPVAGWRVLRGLGG
jgi:MFS family permease